MMLFNKEVLLSDKEQLNEFCDILMGETYNETSKNGIRILIRYLYDCFDAEQQLIDMVHQRMSEDIIPIVSIEFHEFTDLNELDFLLMSTEDREFTFYEEMLFNELCDICFGNVKGLFDRLCSEA